MNAKIEETVNEIRSTNARLHVLHAQLGELVAAEVGIETLVREPGKMLVMGPAPAPSVGAVLDEVGVAAGLVSSAANGSAGAVPKRSVAQKDFPATGVESLPKRLEGLLNANPTKSYSAEEAAKALGDEPRKTHYTLLRRMARKGKISKVGRGTFRAKKTNGKKANG